MTIFDVGFNNGDDSAYYLSLGYNVIAVEANSALAEQGRQRFGAEVQSGRLTILSSAIWQTDGEILPFYANDTDSEWSSLDPTNGKRGGRYHVIDVPTITIRSLFAEYGVPHYLKVDIEGADGLVVHGLPKESALPLYFSCELGEGKDFVDLLYGLGYEQFKLLNQETLTQSTEIGERELPYRVLRKAGTYYPPLCAVIAALPDVLRPARETWDPPRDKSFPAASSGPFGENAAGSWVSADRMRSRIKGLFAGQARSGRMRRYDLHAMHQLTHSLSNAA